MDQAEGRRGAASAAESWRARWAEKCGAGVLAWTCCRSAEMAAAGVGHSANSFQMMRRTCSVSAEGGRKANVSRSGSSGSGGLPMHTARGRGLRADTSSSRSSRGARLPCTACQALYTDCPTNRTCVPVVLFSSRHATSSFQGSSNSSSSAGSTCSGGSASRAAHAREYASGAEGSIRTAALSRRAFGVHSKHRVPSPVP